MQLQRLRRNRDPGLPADTLRGPVPYRVDPVLWQWHFHRGDNRARLVPGLEKINLNGSAASEAGHYA